MLGEDIYEPLSCFGLQQVRYILDIHGLGGRGPDPDVHSGAPDSASKQVPHPRHAACWRRALGNPGRPGMWRTGTRRDQLCGAVCRPAKVRARYGEATSDEDQDSGGPAKRTEFERRKHRDMIASISGRDAWRGGRKEGRTQAGLACKTGTVGRKH